MALLDFDRGEPRRKRPTVEPGGPVQGPPPVAQPPTQPPPSPYPDNPWDDFPMPGGDKTPVPGPYVPPSPSPSPYPDNPWDDFPGRIPGDKTPAPGPYVPPTGMPRTPQGPQPSAWDFSQFKPWYGTDPTQAQLADYTRQVQGGPQNTWSQRYQQVLQNLYRNSPAYNPQYPNYSQWQAPKTPTPPAAPSQPSQAALGADLSSLRSWLDSQAGDYLTKGLKAYQQQIEQASGGKIRVLSNDVVEIGGRKYDIIGNFGGGNPSWWGGDVTDPQGGTGAPQVGGVDLNAYGYGYPNYNDPNLMMLEDLARYRMEELFQPVQDDWRTKFFGMLDERINQLQAPPFTSSQENQMYTNAVEDVNQQRADAHAEIERRMAMLGHGKTSGTLVQAHALVDQQYDALAAQAKRNLDVYGISEHQNRLNQAMGYGATGMQTSQAVRDEEQARRREALSLAGLFPDLDSQSLAQAQSVLSGSPYQPTSLFNQMLGLAGFNRQGAMYGQQQNADFWGGLGSIMAILASGTGNRSSGMQLPGQYFSTPG